MDLSDSTIVINNTESDKEVFLHNGMPSIVINNFIIRNQQVMKPFNNWVADQWTGLYDADEQWGYADTPSSIVEYGATALQVKGKQTGLFLNTFGHDLVTANTATSIQYVVGWKGSENIGKSIWDTKPNDALCVVADLDIHHSFVSDNNSDGVAAVNQALITFLFRVKNTNKSFFYNIELYDSRAGWQPNDMIMVVDGQDTSLPIVITYAHTNNENSIYSSAVPDFGTRLQKFSSGALPAGERVYGACIEKAHMKQIINDIKNLRPDFNIADFSIENIRLDTVIIGPEINTNPTREYNADGSIKTPGYKEGGNMGMNLYELTIYRLGEKKPDPVNSIPSSPENVTFDLNTNSVTLKWKDVSDNELGFKIYKNGKLLQTVSKNITSYTVKNLQPNTEYTFEVVAYNSFGISSPTVKIHVKTKDDFAWLIPVHYLILN